jgi:hypothetical protein
LVSVDDNIPPIGSDRPDDIELMTHSDPKYSYIQTGYDKAERGLPRPSHSLTTYPGGLGE